MVLKRASVMVESFFWGGSPGLKMNFGRGAKRHAYKSKFNVNFSQFFILKAHILYSKIKILKYIIFRNIVKLSI